MNVQDIRSDDTNAVLMAAGGDRRRVSVDAPVWINFVTGTSHQLLPGQNIGFPNTVHRDAGIEITVRELGGSELGRLGSTGAEFSRAVHGAVAQKSAEDFAAYGMTTAQMRERAERQGYFDSPAHNAWAQAAEARTGGRLTAGWWKAFDPFGGTNGNGPNILGGGEYPHALSRIGMAHDTDWSLGRYFNAGPLRGLHGAQASAEEMGKYGLTPTSIRPNVDSYLNGHPDWDVRYHTQQRRAELSGDGQAIANAHAEQHAPRHPLVTQALDRLPDELRGPERLNVAGALAVSAHQAGIARIDHVVASTRDPQLLFAVQGDVQSATNLTAMVNTGTAAGVALQVSEAQLARSAPLQALEEPTRAMRLS